MSDALKKLYGVTDSKQAEKILSQISDRELLGGNFVGDDLKKRVRTLIKKYHPDIPDENLVPDIKTIITQRLISLGENKTSQNGGENSSSSYERDKPRGTSHSGNIRTKDINARIQRIYNNFSSSDKSFIITSQALEYISAIENSHGANLQETKNQIAKLYAKSRYENSIINGDNNFIDILSEFEGLEKVFQVDLNIEKDQIMELAKSRKNGFFWDILKGKFSAAKNKKDPENTKLKGELNEIMTDYRGANYKYIKFERVISNLIGLEKNYGANLTKEKDEVVKLLIQEVMTEYRGALSKYIKFERVMSDLKKYERNYGTNITKEKDEIVRLRVQEVMTEYRRALSKGIRFEKVILDLKGYERNYGANITKEKDEVVRLRVQEVMTEYRGALSKSRRFEKVMSDLKEYERNYGVNLTKEKDEVLRLKDKK